MNNPSLESLHILVTRPVGLADALCNEIKKHGGKITLFPVLEIAATDNIENLQTAIDTVNSYDIAIFISPTAVKRTALHIKLSAIKPTVVAIGEATSSALLEEGVDTAIRPEGQNSESLLEQPSLQPAAINNKRIIIFKGEGGRDLLFDTLTARGASVFNASMYKRKKPEHYVPLSTSALQNIDVILVSSGEGLHNLFDMTPDKSTLMASTIIVPGNRCAGIAKALGFRSVIVTTNATNSSFLGTLYELCRKKP